MRINKVEYDQIVASMQHESMPKQFHLASSPGGVTVALHEGQLYVASPIPDVGFGSTGWLLVHRASLIDGPPTAARALQVPSHDYSAKPLPNLFAAHPIPTSFWDETPNRASNETLNISTAASLLGSHAESFIIPTPTVLNNIQPTPQSTPASQLLFPSQIRLLNPQALAAYSSRWTPHVKTRQLKALDKLQKMREKNEHPERLHRTTGQNSKNLLDKSKQEGTKSQRRYVDASGNEVPRGTANAMLLRTYQAQTLVDPQTGRPATKDTQGPIKLSSYLTKRPVDPVTGLDVAFGTENAIAYNQFIRQRPVDVATGIEVPFGSDNAIPRSEYQRLKRLARKKI
ncbi:MAG: hypothetical protein EOO61_13985 [Hymenobacter sp.]|nr:MAG: hypothetical protein EOO61_13985 [Hymenobacter sp.]